jgi:hypothetical protein
LSVDFQDFINFIPTVITLPIFLAFLKVSKNIKKFKTGLFEYETKDEAVLNSTKDIEQDNGIKILFEKLKDIEARLEKDAVDRKKRQKETDNRLDKQYEFIREAVIKSCQALVFSDNTPLIDFYDAAFLSLYLGSNGNTIDAVVKRNIAGKGNLADYKTELAKFRKQYKKHNQHFEDAIKQIHEKWH